VEPLYAPVWADGKIADDMPNLEQIKDNVQRSLTALRQDHKRSLNPTPYKVGVSNDLYHFIHDLWLENAPIGELS
jgi:nicotinate phosphoribosyltransferase